MRMQSVLLRQNFLNFIEGNFAAVSFNQEQFGAATEKLRGAAFVGLNMRESVAKDGMIGSTQLSECQRICGCAVEHNINVTIGLEDFANPVADLAGNIVLPISGSWAGICSL